MAGLQELISRGRLIFSGAAKRFEVFKLINGKKSTKEIARKTGRSLSSILQDIEKLKNMELVRGKTDKKGKVVRKEKASVYEKLPLIKHVSLSYFKDVADTNKLARRVVIKRSKLAKQSVIHVPTANEILDISKRGEDQFYEFKSPGTDSPKITKEVAAFLHTKNGGIIFYGIEDDGSIIGSDVRKQVFDQRVHNSIRNTITPQPTIEIKESDVLGSKVIMIIIPPWERKTLYQYTKNEKYYIRKGTNVFVLKPDEIKKLLKGKYIV